MKKINILDKNVSDMIAAGEVVESPASVVKELVENSMDAGAKTITVEIKDGGKTLIRVSDDGEGISKADVRDAFLRHGTSKIRSADDLKGIETLGFRGEALSSIAAVSLVELITKALNEEVGTHITIKAGEVISEEEIGCPQGTTFIVRNLFYNTPARMKFLKKDSTEGGRIADILNKIALSHPKISFRLISNGKEMIFTPGDGNLRNVVLNVYGKEYAKSMIEIDYDSEGVKITGLAGNAELARANRSFQTFYINGRYVKSNIFTYSVQEAYKNILTVNRYPTIVLNIDINPEMIDVNVHPTKMEVKFSDEQKIFRAVVWAVKNAIYSKVEVPEINNNSPKKNIFSFATSNLAEEIKERDIEEKRGLNREINIGKINDEKISFRRTNSPNTYIKESESLQSYESISKPLEGKESQVAQKIANEQVDRARDLITNETKNKIEAETELKLESENELINKGLKIIGQLFETYIMIERNNEMLLIDQHAAHERLKYEKLLSDYKNREINPQQLLVPLVLNISSIEMETIRENEELFKKIGFDIDDFGNNSIIVRQTPISLDQNLLKDLIIEIITLIQDSRSESSITDMEYKVLYKIACKGAVKANRKMHVAEMEKLVLDLLSLENINTCPHGRPITIKMTKYTIEKEFKRVGN